MGTHAVSEKPYELAYEASVHAIENQAATVESLRSRAGTILAAAALVTSFFGARHLSAPNAPRCTSSRTQPPRSDRYDSNATQIRRLVVCFRLAIACLLGEVGFWLTGLAGAGL